LFWNSHLRFSRIDEIANARIHWSAEAPALPGGSRIPAGVEGDLAPAMAVATTAVRSASGACQFKIGGVAGQLCGQRRLALAVAGARELFSEIHAVTLDFNEPRNNRRCVGPSLRPKILQGE
jgi:hypothetical protein